MQTKIIIERTDRYVGFTLFCAAGRPLLYSRLFRSIDQCYSGIADVRSLTAAAGNLETLRNNYGQHSFVIRDHKNIILAHSQMFLAEREMYNTIDLVCIAIKEAVIEDTGKAHVTSRLLS